MSTGRAPDEPRPGLRIVEGGGITTPPVRAPIEIVTNARHPYADLIALMEMGDLFDTAVDD